MRECIAGPEGPRGKRFNTRWIASMVAEVHRILMRGGVFMYPVDSDNAPRGGHLRLLYEANPMAFIIEQAGGLAISGQERILDIMPERLHQRTGVILGSKNEVERIGSYYAEADGKAISAACRTILKFAPVSRLARLSRTGAQRTLGSVSTGSAESRARRPPE